MTGRAGIFEAKSIHISGIVALGRKALEDDPAPNQTISQERLYALAKDCVLNKTHYSWVCVKDGEVVSALCALVIDQTVYERKMASVVQFYTIEAGEGEKLMRHFLAWARPQRKIKSIVFMLEVGADPRIGHLLSRMGLEESMPTFIEWR